MLGLLYSDLISIKKQIYITIAAFIIYFLILNNSRDTSIMFFFPILFSAMGTLEIAGIAEKNNWWQYLQCLPLSNRLYIGSKYLLCFIMINCLVLMSTIAIWRTQESLLTTFCLLSSTCLISNAFQLPILLKYGIEKGKFISLSIYPVILVVGGIFTEANNASFVMGLVNSPLLILFICIIVYIFSYYITCLLSKGKIHL